MRWEFLVVSRILFDHRGAGPVHAQEINSNPVATELVDDPIQRLNRRDVPKVRAPVAAARPSAAFLCALPPTLSGAERRVSEVKRSSLSRSTEAAGSTACNG
jgi:hypothetical protein